MGECRASQVDRDNQAGRLVATQPAGSSQTHAPSALLVNRDDELFGDIVEGVAASRVPSRTNLSCLLMPPIAGSPKHFESGRIRTGDVWCTCRRPPASRQVIGPLNPLDVGLRWSGKRGLPVHDGDKPEIAR